MAKLPTESVVYRSFDQITEQSEACTYPTEVLNSLNPPGMPHYMLTLKVGCPIILLRNLDAPRLMNGTRLIVKRLMRNVIVATVMTGVAEGEDVLIPRIGMMTSDFFVDFKRTQFPVRPAFCLTINKAQGRIFLYKTTKIQFNIFKNSDPFPLAKIFSENMLI